jgi:hypothetical protein
LEVAPDAWEVGGDPDPHDAERRRVADAGQHQQLRRHLRPVQHSATMLETGS